MFDIKERDLRSMLNSLDVDITIEDNNPIYIKRYYDTIFNKLYDRMHELDNTKKDREHLLSFKYNDITIICKTTSSCNHNCFYCFDKTNRNNNIILDFNKIIDFFILCCDEFQRVNWVWHGGETTLIDKKVFEEWNFKLTEIALKHMAELNISIQTNGDLLDNEWLDICYKYNIAIGISDDVINSNLSRGYILKDNISKQVNDKITVINKYNIDYLKDIALKNDSDGLITYKLNFVRDRDDDFAATFLGDYNYAIDKYIEYVLWYINSDIKPSDMTLLSFILLSIGYTPVICYQTNCLDYSNIISINFDTDIYKCDTTYNKEIFICSIDEYTGYDIVLNKTEQLRKKVQLLYNNCGECQFSDVCSRGCLNNLLYTNKKDEFYCMLIKKLIPILRNKIANLSPEEFAILNKNVKKCLLDNNYIPKNYLDKLDWSKNDI